MREFQLLLYCARSQPDAEHIKDVVNEGIDWPTLLGLAKYHRVRPLLLQSLKTACWDAVPLPNQLELGSSYRTIVAQNLLFTGELFRLLDIFRKNRIATAAFKGPVLADTVYGDMFAREFVDLDLLVHEADVCKAEQILIARGYKSYIPGRDYRSAFLSYYGQQPFCAPNGVMVDLHWRLASKNVALPIQSAAVWQTLQEVMVAGVIVQTLPLEDLALLLAAHGTMHGWASLLWVCDFAELLRRHPDIDWRAVFLRAQKAHSTRPLLLAILLASILLDAPAPPELVTRARDNSAVRELAEKAQVAMLRPTAQGDFGEFLQGLNTHDLFRYRFLSVLTLLMTRTVNDYQAMPLPKPLWPMYYFTRPVRLAAKVGHIVRAFSR
jgi:Uncharacterised nucleotidyltransferase